MTGDQSKVVFNNTHAGLHLHVGVGSAGLTVPRSGPEGENAASRITSRHKLTKPRLGRRLPPPVRAGWWIGWVTGLNRTLL